MHRSAALLCLFLLAAPAAAQTDIHRCIGANGGAVFTDQPCAALHATPVSPAAASTSVPPPIAPPPLCAASVAELRQSMIDAFANRDANRLAGLMLWDGYGRGAAIADIRSLGSLVRQPLLDIDVPGEPPNPTPDTPPPSSDHLLLHLAGNDGSGSPRELRFGIVRRAGCLWLRNAE